MSDVLKTILLIDNDEAQLSAAESILKGGYKIISANSGGEGLKYLVNGPAPDLVLLDILTPKMGGWETYNQIRALSFTNKTPLVFVASASAIKEKNLTRETGAVDYIIKPYVKEDLLHRVKSLINYHN